MSVFKVSIRTFWIYFLPNTVFFLRVVSAQLDLYDDEMEPFYSMLTPEMLNDMKDYFYLAMLRQQGIDSMDTRKTSLTIPITEIPFVMRAIGYYPTDEEVVFENICIILTHLILSLELYAYNGTLAHLCIKVIRFTTAEKQCSVNV